MRTLDIFCGGGGSSHGAYSANAEIICGIDFSEIAINTYQDNFPSAVTKRSLLEAIRPKRLRDEIGDIDLLLASPECTNHTCAKGAAPRSEASRATAMQAIRFAKAFQPRWIVLENVVHMRPWSRYDELKDKLQALGFNLNELVLDASDFGVAQSRRRLFLIGDKLADPPKLELPAVSSRPTVESILDEPGIWTTTPLRREGRAKATLERADRAISAIGSETPFLIVYYGTDGGGGWQGLDRPLRTITTVDRFALVEPGKKGHSMRMLQVPELRRAMGFGNDYRLEFGTRRDKIRLLGNGVCPPVMQRIVERLHSNR